MGKILLSLALAAAFALPSFAQDIVILKDGTSVDAKVIEVDDNSVRYKKFNNPDGPTYTAKKETISEIRYKNGSKEIFNQAKATSPDKNPNSVWWTKAKETKLGFWMDPLGFAQWGPMLGVSIRVGSNFDVKAHVRYFDEGFPLTEEFLPEDYNSEGLGFGLEFNKLIATTNGNIHVGFLVETSYLEGFSKYTEINNIRGGFGHSGEYDSIYSGEMDGYTDDGRMQHIFALTGGYTFRFNSPLFIDIGLQVGISLLHSSSDMDFEKALFYIDASAKLGYEF